ncbi:MAG: M23 family metallopeptidase [Clostridium sp.]|nr:M23 family metallopeptidase [Clostridium sp.]MDY3829221.1 M23 family metallopeptidase [Clostridium sp.]
MGKYSREYKDYYKKIEKDRDKISKINKKQDKRYYVKKFIYQVVGAVVLLGLLFILKNIPLKEGNDIYVFSKNTLNNDINIKNYKERILDKIDEIKKIVLGEETLKEKIKNEYIMPISGDYKSTNNAVIINPKAGCSEIVASYRGVVDILDEDDNGKYIIINHQNGIETYYGYIKETNVKIGQIVDKGRVIGRCSNKGVYFQIVYMGIEKNPLELINLDNEKKLL